MKYWWYGIRLRITDWYLINIKKPHCALCGQVATLRNDDGSWICEECAQSMNDFGIDYDIAHVKQ